LKSYKKPNTLIFFIVKNLIMFILSAIIIIIITFLLFSFLIQFKFTKDIRYNLLNMDLYNYEQIPNRILLENDLTLDVINENLEVVYSAGVDAYQKKKYTLKEYTNLIVDNYWYAGDSYAEIQPLEDKNLISILRPSLSSDRSINIFSYTTKYSLITFVINILLIILAFIFFSIRIFSHIKQCFSIIQLNIDKTPYNNDKIDMDLSILEFNKLAISYNDMVDKMAKLTEEKNNIDEKSKQLIINLSHDLKTPITTLIGYSKILKDSEHDCEEQKKYISYISEASDRLNIMINILFEQVKFQYTDYNLNLTEDDMNSFLRDIVAQYYLAYEEKGFKIDIDISEEKYIMCFDQIHMKRVFSNILENCIEHNIIPTDVCIFSKEFKDKYVIQFKDNGIGIKDKLKEKIFEPFYQEDISRNSANSGIGLYVARQIIEKHGGNIYLTNDTDYKTIFEIHFNKN